MNGLATSRRGSSGLFCSRTLRGPAVWCGAVRCGARSFGAAASPASRACSFELKNPLRNVDWFLIDGRLYCDVLFYFPQTSTDHFGTTGSEVRITFLFESRLPDVSHF